MAWTKEHSIKMQELLLEMYHEGKTDVEISEATGYAPESITSILNKNGIKRSKEIDRIKIMTLYKRGDSVKEIAEEMKISVNVIYKTLRANGISSWTQSNDEEELEVYISNKQKKEKELIEWNGKKYRDVIDDFFTN